MTFEDERGQTHLPPDGRLAAIDYGRKRIGIAVCDRRRTLASPLIVLNPAARRDDDAETFLRLVRHEDLVGFVVGLPLHADGRESEMSAEARGFGAWLGNVTGLPIDFLDERYTSAEAAGRLARSGISRAGKKARSDAIAAQVLLETWLARAAAVQSTEGSP